MERRRIAIGGGAGLVTAIAAAVASKISDRAVGRGIIIDGAGIGSCMTANKFPGVRAALCYDLSSAANSREHNDANVLTLGAGLIGAALAVQIVDLWLSKECTVDRHRRRVAMIGEIEQKIMGEGNNIAFAPPQTDNVTSTMNDLREVPGLVDLSNEDLERIAKRIVELAGPGGLAAFVESDEYDVQTVVVVRLSLER